MTADEIITELNESFQNEPRPSELNIVYSNSLDYPEVLQVRDAFKAHTWQTLPDELMHYEQDSIIFLSKEGLKYYLPAFLRFALRDYLAADAIPGSLIFFMTLPAEIDVLLSALATKRYRIDESTPTIDWNEQYQRRLRDVNERVHSFIYNYGQFNLAQSRVILHFLEYVRDKHGEDYFDNEPAIAIQRYWFHFA